MKVLSAALHLLATISVAFLPTSHACPFAKKDADAVDIPDDEVHRRSLRRRLSDTPENREAVRKIIDGRTEDRTGGGVEAAGGGDAGAGLSRLLNKEDPTQPFSHVSGLERQLIVSYSSLTALSAVENHVRETPNAQLKRLKAFSRPQKKKNTGRNGNRGGGRGLQEGEEESDLGYLVVDTDEDASAYDAIPGVLAQPDVEVHIDAYVEGDGVKKTVDGEDLAFGRERRLQETMPWGIEFVNVTGLWGLPPAPSPITICVVDTGYDLGHVDLPTNVTGWEPNSAFNRGVWNVDGNGHGTHCAGTIGAVGNNVEGVIGVWDDPNDFRFHIAKGLSDSGSGSGADVLDGVQSCVDAGAKVISMSLGCDNCHSTASESFYNDVYDQNVLVIAAAGNSGSQIDHFPSGYPAVMSVASLDDDGTLSSFSTRNDQTEIAGPGRGVLSTVPGDNYASFSGTSMATPHVAGVAALLWSHFPECTNNQIRNAILHAAIEPPDDSTQNPEGWDIFYGHGNINAGAAYQLLSDRGCVGAGGRFPDAGNGETLSDQSPGGELQIQFGCTSDDHCQESANACAGQQRCDLTTNTCFESSPPVDCDDGFACTIDTCDPTRVPSDLCVHTARVCDDNDACNGIFSCDNSTGCVQDAAPIVCELETECNLASCDALTGECSYTNRTCDDDNICTTDTCDDAIGCIFSPVPDCCGNGICEAEAGETDESCAIDCGAPIGGAPTWLELFPWPEDILSGDSVQLIAKVFDDDIRDVRFRVLAPDGTQTGFQVGDLIATDGDRTTWSFNVDTSAQKGFFGYSIEMRDQSGNAVRFPDITESPTSAPTPRGTEPSSSPTPRPTRNPSAGGAVTEAEYDAIEADVAALSAAFGNDAVSRAHFLGGIVRLVAHDFMDFDIANATTPMGADGCIDMEHPDNSGLPQDVWCDNGCPLTQVYNSNFGHISKADFWVAAGNAVIKIASDDALDLKDSYVSGRVDADSCVDQGLRLPAASGCDAVEAVFVDRLGLTRTDAVALLGAHTIGRGNTDFSGHHGIWVDTVQESTVFDKRYYEEGFRRGWIPRNLNTPVQDWTWGNQDTDSPRFFLNVDMCLFFDIETTFPCCTNTDQNCNRNGLVLQGDPCVTYAAGSSRAEFSTATDLFAGRNANGGFNNDNQPFYDAFTSAWNKATTNGLGRLQPLILPSVSPTRSPTAGPTSIPTSSPIAVPTFSPVAGIGPISPTSPPNASSCEDVASFTDAKGRTQDCTWTTTNGKCGKFGHFCPVSCNLCSST